MSVILFIIILIFLYSQNKRITSLEKKLKDVQSEKSLSPQPIPSYTPSPLSNPTIKPSKVPSMPSVDLHYWFSTDGLLKIGSLLVLFGIAWFVRYAFAENWIGPIGRITIGLLLGVSLMSLGEFITTKKLHQGTIIMALGATTVLITVYAARSVFDMFTPISATIIMLLSLVYVGASSVWRYEPARCLAACFGAIIVPFLTASPNSSSISLMAYLTLITVGILWVVVFTGWRWLSLFIAMSFAFYSLLAGIQSTQSDIWFNLLVFVNVALIIGSSFIMHVKGYVHNVGKEILATALTIFTTIWWIYKIIPNDLQSLTSTVVAFILFIGAYFLYLSNQSKMLIYQYTLLAITMLAAAVSFNLRGPVLQISYITLVATASLLANFILNNTKTAQFITFLLAPISIYNIIIHLFNSESRLLVLTIISLVLYSLGWYWLTLKNHERHEQTKNVIAVSYLQTHFILWHFWEDVIRNQDNAHAIALVTMTILGLIGYVWAQHRNQRTAYLTSLAVIVFVLLRLVFVEVWNMDLIWRVIVFVGIGALFMLSSFFKRSAVVSILLVSLLLLPSDIKAYEASPTTFENSAQLQLNLEFPQTVKVKLNNYNQGQRVIVYDESNQQIIPSQVLSESQDQLTYQVFDTQHTPVPELSDLSISTYVDYPINGPSTTTTTWVIKPTTPQTVQGYTFSFSPNSHLPIHQTVTAIDEQGNSQILINTMNFTSYTTFPSKTISELTISVTHDQPLRVADIQLKSTPKIMRQSAVYFLAEPGITYSLYANPHPHLTIPYTEVGALQSDPNPYITSATLSYNPRYQPPDQDKDGLPDTLDNCPKLANPDQLDKNRNGMGDACEDTDRDGVMDTVDNCPLKANSSQADIDRDGLGDSCDSFDNRLTEQYPFLPWVGMGLVGALISTLFIALFKSPKLNPHNLPQTPSPTDASDPSDNPTNS